MVMYLVRHASAGHRDPGDPANAKRALDDKGVVQAEKIAKLLAGEPISRIVSSPYLRCVQTVSPLEQAVGVRVEIDDRLVESASIDNAWESLAEVSDACLLTSGNAVLCSHGDVIPDLLRRAQLRGMRIHGKSGCSKGSIWALEGWDGKRFACGTYSPIHP